MLTNVRTYRAMAFAALILFVGFAHGDEDVGLLELFNYYEYAADLMSSGQPLEAQFPAIARAGVELVVNLAPVTSPGALPNEAEIVRGLGMEYVHIPVDWDEPPQEDVEQFLNTMKAHAGKRILVHCYANARASAFVYLYRVLQAGHDKAQAHKTLVEIWDLNPGYELNTVAQWQHLLASAEAKYE